MHFPSRTEPVELRRALDTVSLGLFAYLTLVVTAVVIVGGQSWSPSPWVLGGASSAAVWFGSRAFPRWAVRVARRYGDAGDGTELGALSPRGPASPEHA